VLVGKARLRSTVFAAARAGYHSGIVGLFLFAGATSLQNAVAEGDTRTITMHHVHTDEDITITYKRNGRYDEDALKKLNWFLRDWRKEEAIKMDPHLIDLVWEVDREVGDKQPIWVVCGYRSPSTNAMLRRRSKGVARASQHMLGHAMDFYIPNASLEAIRVAGLRMQRGGVGFYPTSGSPFVHLDTGNVRHWPRMTHDQLVRVFPDGRTVHIPSDGRPLAGYALALAEIEKRGNSPSGPSLEAARDSGMTVASADRPNVNPFAKLFGFGPKSDDDEDADTTAPTAAPSPMPTPRAKPVKPAVVAALERSTEKAAVKKNEGEQAKPAPTRVAAAAVMPIRPAAPARPAQAASLVGKAETPNDVIAQRGYWQGLPDGMIAAQPASAAAQNGTAKPRRVDTASADSDLTGALAPFSANDDRVPTDLALAYAAQPNREPARVMPPMASQATRSATPIDTTIVVKHPIARSALPRIDQRPVALASVGTQYNNPWMRAVVMSPSVHQYLTITMLGRRDFLGLEPLMQKPASAVMMTFSDEPQPSLAHDRFSGSAIVFVSTVTFSTRTAALQ
jgi:uncharacterized protein YcbK (DUF882 family)